MKTIYVHGTSPEWGIRAANNFRWDGKISGGVLTLNKLRSGRFAEFKLNSPTELQGHFTPNIGIFAKR